MLSARAGTILVSAALLLAGCGSDDGSSSPPAATSPSPSSQDPTPGSPTPEEVSACLDAAPAKRTVKVVGLDFFYKPKKLELPAGDPVTIVFENKGHAPHTFTIDALDCDTGRLGGRARAKVTFEVPKGKTEFYCTIHPSPMTGVLVGS
ncbi:MAG: cupredoxin domain-containing protein [Actinomycetota bacterium]